MVAARATAENWSFTGADDPLVRGTQYNAGSAFGRRERQLQLHQASTSSMALARAWSISSSVR